VVIYNSMALDPASKNFCEDRYITVIGYCYKGGDIVPKLTDDERVKAMYELKSRLINAIEQTPKGLTDYEIRQAILEVSIDLKILAKE